MEGNTEAVNEVMNTIHLSANQIYEYLIDGDKEELDAEIDSLKATLDTIKKKNA